ncbi:MAG: prevent-host-death protein, partial [Spirochaetaceae bacterium]|nr:prevent-host-death protein [Spirochaetaceae bacterium]
SITNHGKEVFALLRWDMYECIEETLEILADEKLSKDLKIGIKQIKENKLIDFDDFKAGISCTK